jgi:hypothetical protein
MPKMGLLVGKRGNIFRVKKIKIKKKKQTHFTSRFLQRHRSGQL